MNRVYKVFKVNQESKVNKVNKESRVLKENTGDTGEQGIQGIPGVQGEAGSDATVTSSNITDALGYTPISPTQLSDKVKTDVPLNAEFTDTVTTINGKTGAISKADIVALGIPAQDTIYTHPSGTNPHGTTKSDVGLGNVTNDKQMPISGGV